MRRLVIVLAAAAAVGGLTTPIADADGPVVVSGGGTGTFAADLDPGIDPDVDGSHFGLGAIFSGSIRGHFECLMAGNADILGLPLMTVEGTVMGGWANAATGTAMLTGVATVNLGSEGRFRGVPFEVLLSAGGPGAGRLQLTVIGAFDTVPGDAVPGNGNYDLPVETVETGQIRIH